ncbi:MAG: lysophospholipid acyltransferase family protein [Acidobacteriota bacterium]|nr:lysophospholipid acyltransferase family protein [Acidobacteriota bacterium]
MGKQGKLQTALEYSAVRTVLAAFGIMPRSLAIAAGCDMGRLFYRLSGRLRRAGMRNLKMAFPEMSESERERILRGCFLSLGRQLGEFSQFRRATLESLTRVVDCVGLENLEEAKKRGKGVLLFTGHLGAWELSSFALSAFGHPLSFIVRRMDNEKIEPLIESVRSRFGNRTIDKFTSARKLLRTLHDGETLGVLVDLNTHPPGAVFVDFFGIPAATTTGLANLALRTDAAVLPVFAPWDKERQRYVLHVDPPVEIERTGDAKEDIRRLTSEVTSVVEAYVRRYPEQWLWIHKRWNTRPPGEADLYQ